VWLIVLCWCSLLVCGSILAQSLSPCLAENFKFSILFVMGLELCCQMGKIVMRCEVMFVKENRLMYTEKSLLQIECSVLDS